MPINELDYTTNGELPRQPYGKNPLMSDGFAKPWDDMRTDLPYDKIKSGEVRPFEASSQGSGRAYEYETMQTNTIDRQSFDVPRRGDSHLYDTPMQRGANTTFGHGQTDRSQIERSQIDRSQIERSQIDLGQIARVPVDHGQTSVNQHFDTSPREFNASFGSTSTSINPAFDIPEPPASWTYDNPAFNNSRTRDSADSKSGKASDMLRTPRHRPSDRANNLSEFYSEEPKPKTFADKAREVFNKENFKHLYNKFRLWLFHQPEDDIASEPAVHFFYDLDIDSVGHIAYRISPQRFNISERFAVGTLKIYRMLSSVSGSPLVYCMANLSEQSMSTGLRKSEVRPMIISFNCGMQFGGDTAPNVNTAIFFSEKPYDEAVETYLTLFSQINCKYYIVVCTDEGKFSEAAIFCR
ncbi:MAG: hypothetical protein LBL96_00755 [Clostridiales bacterium]|nr:hypothetical protein [Clostridiales bacterium]